MQLELVSRSSAISPTSVQSIGLFAKECNVGNPSAEVHIQIFVLLDERCHVAVRSGAALCGGDVAPVTGCREPPLEACDDF